MGLEKVDSNSFEITPFLGLRAFAPFQLERSDYTTRIRLFWHRIVLWSLFLAILAWTTLASGAYFYVKYGRGFTTVHYTHLIFFPWQKDDYRKAKCEFLIAKGKRQFAEKKYLESFYNMRLGLLEVPGDIVARQNLARLYHSVKRYDLAEQILLDGVSYNIKNFDYVVHVFQYLFSLQRDEEAIKQAGIFLGLDDLRPDVHNMLVLAEASAHFFRGRTQEAQRILRNHKLTSDRIGGLLNAQITWERGDKDAALRLLAIHAQRFPEAQEIYNQQVAYLLDVRKLTDLRSICVLRQIEHPSEPQPFVDELLTISLDDEAGKWTHAVEGIFKRFQASSRAMDALSELAVSQALPELAERVYRNCKTNDLPWIKAGFAMVEANLNKKRYSDALKVASFVLNENIDWANVHGAEFNALKAVANFALGDTSLAELQLQSYLHANLPETHNLVAVADHLISVGAYTQACNVLYKSLAVNEFNQPALTKIAEIEDNITDASIVHAERLLSMRTPSKHALQKLAERLHSDRYLLEPGRVAILGKIASSGYY